MRYSIIITLALILIGCSSLERGATNFYQSLESLDEASRLNYVFVENRADFPIAVERYFPNREKRIVSDFDRRLNKGEVDQYWSHKLLDNTEGLGITVRADITNSRSLVDRAIIRKGERLILYNDHFTIIKLDNGLPDVKEYKFQASDYEKLY